jgi:hypothetical protein
VVEKALEKDPGERYQSMRELVVDLKRLGQQSPVADVPGPKPPVTTSAKPGAPPTIARRWKVLAPAAGNLAARLAGAVLTWRLGGPRRPVTSASEYIQLSNFNDSATAPALSPDGRMVTFFCGGGYFLGSGQICVKLLPDGESKQLEDGSGLTRILETKIAEIGSVSPELH